jgi:energy-coupling factor transport system permease protein
MNIFLYLDKDTWFHRLDPRTKLLAAGILFGMALTFNHPLWTAALAVMVGVVATAVGALPNFYRLRVMLILLLVFSSLMWPFFAEGPTTLWSWGPLEISEESLLYAIAMGLRLTSLTGIGLIFLSTTTNEDFTNALIRLRLPYPVAFAFSTALRLVPTFAGAGATIVQAQVSRGLDIESGGIFKRVGRFIPLGVPLFIYAIRHTNMLAMALESRGFSPLSDRTLYAELKIRRWEFVLLLAMLLAWAGMIYLRLQGYGEVLPRL